MDRTLAPDRHVSLLDSAQRAISGSPFTGSAVKTLGRKGAIFFLDITANTGVFTLDVKIQGYDETADAWYDIAGAAFAQQNSTGHVALEYYPGIKETANAQISGVLPNQIRAHATMGGAGTDATYSVQADLRA